jgi:hypothetical protein
LDGKARLGRLQDALYRPAPPLASRSGARTQFDYAHAQDDAKQV